MPVLIVIFWIVLFLIFWTYIGYICFLWFLSLFRKASSGHEPFTPRVSLLITAYNEEKNIAGKIENCLSLDYPGEKLEIIIISDGSTDRTEEIVRSYGEKGIKLLALPNRGGKDISQGKGVAVAGGEILILTDTTTMLKKDAVKEIVGDFSDSNVGCVSGVDAIIDSDSSGSGEGAYVKYEMFLRSLENKVNSLIVVSGCFFAVRKELCDDWHGDLTSDFYLPIIARMKGYRTALKENAVGYYGVADDPQREFERKVRTVVNGIRVLFRFKKVMNPFLYGLYSLQMISHKLLRWSIPIMMIILLAVNVLLYNQGVFYQISLAGQFLFYLAGLLALMMVRLQKISVFKIPFFFLMVNFAALKAWYKVLAGEKYMIWEPTQI